jgi:flagellar protein FlaG
MPPRQHTAAEPDVLQQAAQRVVDAMEQGGNSFRFSFDKQSGMTIVRVINRATGELVRQIPTEELVHLAQLLRQDEQRSLLDVTV